MRPLTTDGETAALFPAVFNRPLWNDEWTTRTAGRRLAGVLDAPGGLGYVAVDDGVCGFAVGRLEPWYSGDRFCRQERGVRSDRRREGVGTAL